jgi:hypothetical protein
MSRANGGIVGHQHNSAKERTALPLRIAITVDPEIPVPPVLYGGMSIVDVLVRGLVQRGHDVTLFANPDSQVPCRLVPTPICVVKEDRHPRQHVARFLRAIHRGRFDLVHSFARLAYLTPRCPRIPKIMSYQRGLSPRRATREPAVARDSEFYGLHAQLIRRWRPRRFHVVYNGVPLKVTTGRSGEPDAPWFIWGG